MELTAPAEAPALAALLEAAFEARRAGFPPEVIFSAPSFKRYRSSELDLSGEQRFAALSVTGRRCDLGCDHCRGTLLRSMAPAETPEALVERAEALATRGCRGLLVSGGCNARGAVALGPLVPAIGEVRRRLGLAVAVHTGLLDRETARDLAREGVDCVMVDLVGSRETIREVLHLDVGPEAYEEALSVAIDAGLPVVPHVVVGLHRGTLRGEAEAIAMAARHDVAALVIVILRQEPGTPFDGEPPLPPEAVARLLAGARLALPARPLMLGCARPVGAAARAIEAYALRAGVNGVAFPADETVRLARSLGLTARVAEGCCALPVRRG